MAHLIEELGDLYSQVEELHVEDTKKSITEVISVLIDEGYSDSAITCYFETQESINIVEKFVNISEDYIIPDTNTERISSIYQEGWAGRLGKALIRSGKPILRKAKNFVTGGAKAASKSGAADDVVKSTSRTAGGNTVTGSSWKSGANPKGKPGGDVPVKGIKDTVKDGINSVKKGVKDNPVGTAAAGVVGGGILATSIATGDAANKKAKKELEKQKSKSNNMGVLTPGGISKKPVVKKTPSTQTKGGEPITNRRGRVTGYTKGTDAEGKSFPSTAEIRAANKGKVGGGNAGASTDSGGTAGKTTVTPKPEVKVQKTSERDAWLKKTSNSPAAKAGLSDDQRWAARQKNQKWKKDNNRGEFATGKSSKQARIDRRNARLKSKGLKPVGESYDAYDIVLDYLLETNQVATVEEANYVMLEMDSKTIQDIVNNK